LDELWRFICKINAVCDILDRNGKDFPQIRQEINDIKGNTEKYLSDNNIQYYDIHRSREFNNFKMHFYIQNYSNIMLNKFKSQLDDFCSKIYKPNDTNVTFHSIDEAMTLIKENINYTDEYFLYNALCNLDKGMSQFFNLQSKYMDIFKELTSSTDENISNYIKRQPEEMVTIIESSLNEKCPMPNINEETSKEITEHIKKKFDELRIKKDLKEMFLNVLYELESTAFKKDFPVEVIEPKLVAFLKTIPLEELTDSREDANRDSGLDKNKKKVVISISAENYLVWQKFKKECCNV
jgi:hypothetical protein